MGLPVPHGFTVTCEACNAPRAAGRRLPDSMLEEAAAHLRGLGRWLAHAGCAAGSAGGGQGNPGGPDR